MHFRNYVYQNTPIKEISQKRFKKYLKTFIIYNYFIKTFLFKNRSFVLLINNLFLGLLSLTYKCKFSNIKEIHFQNVKQI